ncbi:Lrp/AsnC family transcriptional regulator [Candidatus Woesearchaeota archaeon]|nr:Lrp/AsnC family transcriptional regulator [Candidatus Woesearchaeota archaeon]
MKHDELDKQIMNLLLENSKLSYRQIAKKLKVSAATIMNRTKLLEKGGIIKNYTISIDYEKVGFDIEAIIEMRISKGKLIEVEKKIATNPNVFAVYDITGDFDAIILARFENRRRLDTFLKKIQTYDFVERVFTKVILNTLKEQQLKFQNI